MRFRLAPTPAQEQALLEQQQALRDFAQAMSNFFAGTHRRPTWRKTGVHEGFRIVGQRGKHWDLRRLSRKTGQVWVPKVGWVKFPWSRQLPEEAKSFRVRRDRAGRWHVAFAVIPPPIDGPGTGEVVGVDRGISVSAALSTGERLSVPGLRAAEADRMRRLQRRPARAKPGSNRRAWVKTAIGRLKARETDRRKDWVEQTSTALARRYDLIRVEDLKIKNMVRSARGTLDAPGTKVRAKAGQRHRGRTCRDSAGSPPAAGRGREPRTSTCTLLRVEAGLESPT